ncbi:MAG TPA: hypothetical protein VFY25_11465 [Anaerolineales bacterium]|nr:hypothetical protein [Anaerolineales bacterium]
MAARFAPSAIDDLDMNKIIVTMKKNWWTSKTKRTANTSRSSLNKILRKLSL